MSNSIPASISRHDTAGHADGGGAVGKAQQYGEFDLSVLCNKLAIIKGRSELLAIDGHSTDSSRNAGRIIGQAVREIEELLGLPARNRELQAAANTERLKRS